ncbi:hypothetical protein D3C77_192660 [compost metagenome]
MRGIVSSLNQKLLVQPSGLMATAYLYRARYIAQKTGVAGVSGVSHNSKCLESVGCGVVTPWPRCSDGQVYRSVAVYQSQQALLSCWQLEPRQPRRFGLSLMGRGK